jgi:histidinol-phosphate aminotransferase
MFLERFRHLYDLKRVRIPERTDGPASLRLHRNEKPNNWPKDLLERIFASVPDHVLQRYPDAGLFYAKLAGFLGVPVANVLVTSGIEEPIRTILTLCCEPGDTFVSTPGYAMYEVYGRIFGLRLEQITYVPDRFMAASEFCARVPPGTKVVFLPNPSQPVENCFDLESLRQIAGYCKDRDILLAVDEAYHFFGGPSGLPLINEFDNLLVLRSFSKAFGAASLRLGYVVGSSKALAPLASFRLAHEANALSLHAGSVLLDCFESHVKPSIEAVCQGRDFLRRAAINHGLKAWGSVSNNVFIDLGDHAKMRAVTKGLEEREIYVKGGYPAPLDRHILVTCGPPDMMARFFDALLEVLRGKAV